MLSVWRSRLAIVTVAAAACLGCSQKSKLAPAPPGQAPSGASAPKWRGFLPAHGTNEDRPGWWTPDYGGGTSA